LIFTARPFFPLMRGPVKRILANAIAGVICHESRFALVFAADAMLTAQQALTAPWIGTVGPRFQSYSVEMVEIIGGCFYWIFGVRMNKLESLQHSLRASKNRA